MTLFKKNRFTLGVSRDKVFLSGHNFSGQFITIKALATGLPVTHLAVLVPTRVSAKAVARNRTRRKISEIIKILLPRTKSGYDVVILAKTEKLPSDANLLEDALTLWKKSDMLKQ